MELNIQTLISFGALLVSCVVLLTNGGGKLGKMETKIDMLLANSNENRTEIKEHSKDIAILKNEQVNIKQDVSYLQDTLRIRKVMGEIKE